MCGYIYKTTNLINGKIYIGQHRCSEFDKKYFGSGYVLKQAISKYGIDNFVCEVLEWCDNDDDLDRREIFWISYYNSIDRSVGYNISNGGSTTRFFGENHPMYGKHHSQEAIEKNRLAHIGKKQSPETIEKRISGLRGKPLSKEHREKISKANKGKPYPGLSDEGRKRISEAAKNRVITEETRKKLREMNLGRKASEETRKKLSESHKGQIGCWTGKHRDEETKQKIREALLGKPNYAGRIKFYVGDKFFNGLDEGAEFFGITKSAMSLWVKRGYTRDKTPIIKITKI